MRGAVEIWALFRAVEGDVVTRWAVVLEDLGWRPIGLFYATRAEAERACREMGLEVIERECGA